jgi:hypothetical protein
LWALKALRDEPLELFAAASPREARTIEEIREPTVALRPMTSGGEVVEDYRHVGLTLRQHPASFLRADLASRRIVTCIEAINARDGKWLTTAGLALVRQKPGSAKGVMFITIEDETGVANLVIWPSLYERQRRIILAAGMIAVQGRIQREGDVVHLVANHLTGLSADLAGVGDRDDGFPLPHGRGDEFHHGSPGIDPRSLPQAEGHPHSRPPHRQHQGEDAGFQIAKPAADIPLQPDKELALVAPRRRRCSERCRRALCERDFATRTATVLGTSRAYLGGGTLPEAGGYERSEKLMEETSVKRSALIVCATLLAATSAFGQNPPAQSGPNNNAVNSAGQNNSNAPVAGSNSFTEGQAKSKIEGAGFANVSGLKKDDSGVWRGKADKGGSPTEVSVDFQGNVNTTK